MFILLLPLTSVKRVLTQPFLAFLCITCHGKEEMTDNKICSKCQGSMIQGNYTGTPAKWAKEDEYSFLEQSGQRILTYACEKCGYMESYVKK